MTSWFENLAQEAQVSTDPFPLMPQGEAVDMGFAEDGTPLFDPRIFCYQDASRVPVVLGTTVH